MAPSETRGQKQAQQQGSFAGQQDTAGQSNDSVTLQDQMTLLIGMMTTLTTRIDTLEARSRPSSPAPQQPAPQQPSPQPPATLIPTAQLATQEDKRWRPEEIGYFDGTGDVYAFTDRMTSIAANKSIKLIQANLVTLLKDKALNWYHYELQSHIKFAYNTSTSIEPWCQALIERFGPSHAELMSQLEAAQYTRKDAANKRDATAYIQDIMRITNGLKWTQKDGLMTAFHHFEAGLQRDLDPPDSGLTAFIKQVQLRQEAWFQVYSTFGKSRPPDLLTRYPQQPPRTPYQQPPRPPYRPPSRPSNPPPAGPPQQPRSQAYWAEQEEEQWEYDGPTDSYHAAPTYHPSGHTPRRYGNTHDGGGNEAMVHWASAGENHRCSQEGCTHYH